MGLFLQEKNNPRRMTSHNLQNGQYCCRTRAPPSASFGNISAKNQATKPALEPNWAPGFNAYCCRAPSPISPVHISTGIPSTGLCFFYHTIIITEVDDDGMITLLHNHPDSGRRFPRRRDGKGRTGGLTTKAETVARRGRQRRRDDKGRNGGATTKGAAAR